MNQEATPEGQPTPDQQVARHHWLVSGKVIFLSGDEGNEAGNFEHNTVITNTGKIVTARMIGQAQQMLQMELFKQLPDPRLKIVNVHIQGVHYLGEMTKDQFYTPPPAEETAEGETGPNVATDQPDPFKVH
jgi:hypothetical protein